MVPSGGLAGHPEIYNQGMWIGSTGSAPKIDVDQDCGPSEWTDSLHMFQFADSAEEAVEMLLQHLIQTGSNFPIADGPGDAYVVEMAAGDESVQMAGDSGEHDSIYTTGSYPTKEMLPACGNTGFFGEHLTSRHYPSSTLRHQVLWDMVSNYTGKLDLSLAKMVWRFPDNPPSESCGGECSTGWRNARRVGILYPDKGDSGVACICTSPPDGLIRPSSTSYSDCPERSTHSFYRLTLGRSSTDVSKDAKNTELWHVGDPEYAWLLARPAHAGGEDRVLTEGNDASVNHTV